MSPAGFTPSPRHEATEHIKDMSWVYDVRPCGPGLMVVRKDSANGNGACYASLIEDHGWYQAGRVPKAHGDVHILMPITEVPGA